jgi:ATP-binding cassette, subfamily B, bacterial PglK
VKKALLKLWQHLNFRRRRQFFMVQALMLISAFIEVVSLGAVLPFLSILTAPEQVFEYPIVADMALQWGITSPNQLVLPITVAFGVAALLAGATRIILLWVSTRLAVSIGTDLSIEAYRRTLYQPYSSHVARNSSEVISGITNKVNTVVFGVLLPFLILVSSSVLLVAILTAMIVIDPVVAFLAAIGFGGSYALISWISRRRLQINGERIAYEQTQVVKALKEGLGGIRDILLSGTQPVYCDIYVKTDYPLRRAMGNNSFIGGSPRYILEALGMALIASLAYVVSRQSGGIASALPVLGALALAAQRMLPAMQQMYGNWAGMAGALASLTDTLELLDQPIAEELLQSVQAPLVFDKDIRFRDVRFRYTPNDPWVLDGLNFEIQKGMRVGVVGGTGSGKTTMSDLFMGLLAPNEGEILVDGHSINGDHVRAWQQTIAHVPQNIYLCDATIAENIALGVPPDDIDLNRVREVSRQAQIADFIESSSEGYQAYVGEHGIRISGGQRQRIGIARALYKQASVLVFDEATSALDNNTEQLLMTAIEGLNRDFTVLLIAHRLTTVQRCDTIIELQDGRIVAQGSYKELLESSTSFRKMSMSK